MELKYTNKQAEMQRKVRAFAEVEIAPLVFKMEQDEAFPIELIRTMAQQRLMGIPIPAELGGAGADFISYIIAVNEIAKVSAAVGVILSVHTSVGTIPIMQYGTEEQRKKYVQQLASGASLGAFALTEPQAGSDAAAIRTTAVYDGDHYILNGSKVFITNAGAADLYLTFAMTDPSKGPAGMTAFLIESTTKGLHIGPKEKKMGLHGSNTCELIFTNMKIPVSQRLGSEGDGFAIAKGSLDGGRIGIGAQALGIAEAAIQLLDQYLSNGIGKKKLRSYHAEIAELMTHVEASRLLVYHAAYRRQEGLSCTKEASIAKMFASDTAVKVTGAVVKLLGKEGCMKELSAERLFRDAKVTQIYEGTNEIHRIVISQQLLR